jgi:hypothetical protein
VPIGPPKLNRSFPPFAEVAIVPFFDMPPTETIAYLQNFLMDTQVEQGGDPEHGEKQSA